MTWEKKQESNIKDSDFTIIGIVGTLMLSWLEAERIASGEVHNIFINTINGVIFTQKL